MSTLSKIFVWPMECGVNYHRLIKSTEREWMSFVLPALDTEATSQGHYFGAFWGFFFSFSFSKKSFPDDRSQWFRFLHQCPHASWQKSTEKSCFESVYGSLSYGLLVQLPAGYICKVSSEQTTALLGQCLLDR